MDKRVETAIQIIYLESHKALPVRELARRVNLSLWHFDHIFKAETSLSPKQYIRRFKMKKAEALLSESFLSIKQIAAGVGLGDRSHFSRDFKKALGQAPSEFRARRRMPPEA